ncbi:hypothetical protein [Legionella tunisiensis]|uniref:hypothetical protein n=1 Tax=Legionella tunisiensis TaxID=1034944 RepID=UPI00035D17F9|nr:hypothetical protein [Legionella tunisiensis]
MAIRVVVYTLISSNINLFVVKIDIQAVKDLCGNSKEVVVYGFNFFNYQQLYNAINSDGSIKAYNSDDYEYKNDVKVSNSHSYSHLYAHFKFILNDLLLENYKRQQKGEPLVPLIFVVGLNNNQYDKSRIFERANDPSDKGVTLTELRRCYKLANEFGKEMTEVAQKTFQFVQLIGSDKGYKLETVEPFWKDEQWKKGWEERKNHRKRNWLR